MFSAILLVAVRTVKRDAPSGICIKGRKRQSTQTDTGQNHKRIQKKVKTENYTSLASKLESDVFFESRFLMFSFLVENSLIFLA